MYIKIKENHLKQLSDKTKQIIIHFKKYSNGKFPKKEKNTWKYFWNHLRLDQKQKQWLLILYKNCLGIWKMFFESYINKSSKTLKTER